MVEEENQTNIGTTPFVPIDLNLEVEHHSYRISANEIPEKSGYMGYAILIERSTLILITCIFIMLLMWGLTFVNIFIVWEAYTGRVKADLNLFVYMSSFIVAMYFFRQVFPDIPPFVGVLADYLAFFWVEFIAALAAILLSILWIRDLKKNQE